MFIGENDACGINKKGNFNSVFYVTGNSINVVKLYTNERLIKKTMSLTKNVPDILVRV